MTHAVMCFKSPIIKHQRPCSQHILHKGTQYGYSRLMWRLTRLLVQMCQEELPC